MLKFRQFLLASLLLSSAAAAQETDAHVLVDSQVQAAAAAVAVLEKQELPPAARARLLLPIASELARLHALRCQVNAQQLAEEEARAAANADVQRLALRLLRAMELCAAADYSDSPELEAALRRLSLAIEGEVEPEAPGSQP